MLLEFGVKNFRSIKDEAVFSLIANDNESKTANVFTHQLATGEKIRLLKSAAIFGANASGKSTVLQAMHTFKRLIFFNNAKAEEELESYTPFLFNSIIKNQPVSFWLTFIGRNNYKYFYKFSFDNYNITEEQLNFYPNGINKEPLNILNRSNIEDTIHTGELGKKFGNKEYKLFHNQLFISKFGKEEPHEFITPIFTYFAKYNIINTLNDQVLIFIQNLLTKKIRSNPVFLKKLETLIQIADTKLYGIAIEKDLFAEKLNSEEEDRIEFIHKVFNEEIEIGTDTLDFNKESVGTQRYFFIGGMILDALDKGGILFIDELDSSLHPMLVKTLIHIVQSKKLNPKNAQVVFTTHDINVLDRNLLRIDQYWFTDKNKFGETELFSLQDFEKVDEDTPFDNWYMAGRFGAIPNIQSIEKILDGTKETD